MKYRVTVTEGRRALSYEVEAMSEDEAKELYLKWLSFRGALVVQEVEIKSEEAT